MLLDFLLVDLLYCITFHFRKTYDTLMLVVFTAGYALTLRCSNMPVWRSTLGWMDEWLINQISEQFVSISCFNIWLANIGYKWLCSNFFWIAAILSITCLLNILWSFNIIIELNYYIWLSLKFVEQMSHFCQSYNLIFSGRCHYWW